MANRFIMIASVWKRICLSLSNRTRDRALNRDRLRLRARSRVRFYSGTGIRTPV